MKEHHVKVYVNLDKKDSEDKPVCTKDPEGAINFKLDDIVHLEIFLVKDNAETQVYTGKFINDIATLDKKCADCERSLG